MNQDRAAVLIRQHIAERIGLHVLVAATKRAIFLSGRVPSQECYWLAEHIAARDAPDKQIENYLVVEYFLPLGSEGRRGFILEDMGDELPVSLLGFEKQGIELESIPPEELLETNVIHVVDPDVFDADEPVEPEPAYFPSTDPVIGSTATGRIIILGGFAPSSTTGISVAPSAEDGRPGDEAMSQAIRWELRKDALTTDLRIRVRVEEGVASLFGTVPSLVDAENAEEVANRIPGVHEVIDHLELPSEEGK
jgi:hypothetical protein